MENNTMILNKKERSKVVDYICDIELKDLNITLPCYGSLEEPLFWWKDVRDLANGKEDKPSLFLRTVDLDEEDEVLNVILGVSKKVTGKLEHGGLRSGTDLVMFTEEGLYTVLMSKPKLKQFRKPIKKILKILRQDGLYITGEEEANAVDELNSLLEKAYERKILRKYGIGVRKDLTSVIKDSLNPTNKFVYSTVTDNLIYIPTVGKKASQLKKEFGVSKLRDDHFSNEELNKIAEQEKFVSNLLDKFKDYGKVKEIVNM